MTPGLRGDLKWTCLFGTAVIAIFLVGGVVWAIQAPLGGAVIAKGIIGSEGKRQTVQHLEGGIIKEILVKEGSWVKAGATLLVLDDTMARARTDELLNRIRTLAAREARLHAERARRSKINFDHPLLQPLDAPEVAAIVEQQRSYFKARANNLKTRRGILRKRIRQLKQQERGLRKQLLGARKQMRLIREEAEVVDELVRKGLERKPRLLALLRAEAQVVAKEGELIASIARVAEAVGETLIRISNQETNLLEDVDAKLTQVQAERASLEELYREIIDRLSRTRVVSPVEGVVLDISFKTVGGVIRPGERILDIVPAGDELIINARIHPTDIDEVKVGSSASIMFTAFQRRYLKRIKGKVVHVSADAFEDKSSGARYFMADIKIDRKHLAEVAPKLTLTPGMPAEVFISTEERTFADYLIQPLKRSFARAFRES